ncbi:tol-pal system YbgF family protein [Parabacteroides sp. APC149_11_2_Y6]
MDAIKQLILEGKTDEAIRLLDDYIKNNAFSDEAYYLRGNAYIKKGDIRQGLNNYLKAVEINPESPAQVAYDAQIRIMNFYNKDMYNH